MNNTDRLKYVTGHFHELQGLRWVILGILALLSAAEDVGWIPMWIFVVIILPLVLVILAATVYIYRRAYGTVTRPAGLHGVYWTNMLGVLAIMVAFQADQLWEPALLLTPLGFAFWVLLRYSLRRQFRLHYLLIAIAVSVVDIAIVVARPPASSLWAHSGFVTWGLIGSALIAIGLIDHLLFVRTFRPLPTEPEPEYHV